MMEKKMETIIVLLGISRGYIGILEKKFDTTIVSLFKG